MRRFFEVIEELSLKDLPSFGGQFMWYGGLNSQVASRLDRFLVSDEWGTIFRVSFNVLSLESSLIIAPFLWRVGGLKKARFLSTLRICGFCQMGSKS